MCNDAHPGFVLFARVSAYGRKVSRQRGHSRDHTTRMQSEESRRVTNNGGRVELTKTQARTEREVGPEVDGLGPRATTDVEIGCRVHGEPG